MLQAPFPPPSTLYSIDAVQKRLPSLDCGDKAPDRCVLLRASVGIRVDALLEDCRRLEHHHAPRRDRHFLAGLRVSPNALPLLAHDERAERRQFHGFAPLEAIRDFLQYHFYESRRLGSRQPDFLVHGLAEVRPRHRLARHRLTPLSATTLS